MENSGYGILNVSTKTYTNVNLNGSIKIFIYNKLNRSKKISAHVKLSGSWNKSANVDLICLEENFDFITLGGSWKISFSGCLKQLKEKFFSPFFFTLKALRKISVVFVNFNGWTKIITPESWSS